MMPGRRFSRLIGTDGAAIAIALLLVGALFAVTVPEFAAVGNLRYFVAEEVPILVITAAIALTIIVGGIDLSVGAVLGLSAGVSLWTSMSGLGPVPSVLAGVGTGALFGVVNGLIIVGLRLNDFIVTLGTLNVAAGLLVVLTGRIQLTGTDDDAYVAIARTPLLGVTTGILIAAAVAVLMHLLLRYTTFGRRVRATGLGVEPARVAGIDTGRVKFLCYVVSGSLAGLGGVLLASRLNSVQAAMTSGYELTAVAAAVLGGVSLAGGRGGIWQAVLGALFLATLRQGFRLLGVDPMIFAMITGLCIIVGVVADRSLRDLANRLTLRDTRRSIGVAQ